MLVADYQNKISNPGATASASRKSKGTPTMFKTFATEADFNAAMTAEFARGAASVDTSTSTATVSALAVARAEGATGERERILAIEATPLAAHHADTIKALKADGKSTAGDAAVAILAAESALQASHAKNAAAEVEKPVPSSQVDPAKEAAKKDEVDPIALAGKITAHIATAKKEGRTINSAQAHAELEAAAK